MVNGIFIKKLGKTATRPFITRVEVYWEYAAVVPGKSTILDLRVMHPVIRSLR